MNGKAWTTAEELTLWELKKQGHTYAEIARRLGRSLPCVLAHIRSVRLREGNYEPVPKHRWTMHDISEMIRMESEGFAVWAIAEKIGVSQCAIYQKRRELRKNGDLPEKRKKSPPV